ncbi:MAG: MBL fold metallo-hydrolase, partial [bacterium]
LLIHDAQYTPAEYDSHVGWGHSSIPQAMAFAGAAGAKRLVTFHHDPSHGDEQLDRLVDQFSRSKHEFELVPGKEGARFEL